MNKIFLGFGGSVDSALGKRVKVSDSFEVLNLTKFDKEELLSFLREEVYILPHILKKKNDILFPFNFEEGKKMTWGMLVSENLLNTNESELYKVIGMINLYADRFLVPLYKVDHLGGEDIRSWSKGGLGPFDYWSQGMSHIFLGGNFIKFCGKLKTQTCYTGYNTFNFEKWLAEKDNEKKKNHFRIYLAFTIFRELKAFQSGKDTVLFLKEAFELAIIIEALLVNRDEERMKAEKFAERSELLISFRDPTVKKHMKTLYDKRSEYAHGDYYKTLARFKPSSSTMMPVPMPDFAFFEKSTDYIRDILTVYMYLNALIQAGHFGKIKSVHKLIQDSERDATLKNEITKYAEEILKDRSY